MSFAEDYIGGYRVKFVDIRVNPPGGRRKRGAAAELKRCEQKGCDALGACKAPKPFAARVPPAAGQKTPPDDSHWFCQRHAAEYNSTYDFFDGMTEAEISAFQASAAYGHKQTWKMGGGPVGGAKAGAAYNAKTWRGRHWFDNSQEAGAEPAEREVRDRTRLQMRALEEMQLPPDASREAVRERYGLLVKRYHPDSNGGDRSMEPRLTVVIRAFKALKSSGLA
ncbi:MAG: J domain-containing protein [Alphaproteobacteria bacterium]|nr:J domain-containing protein [Alphaproteobacteria bacterium]